MIQKSKQKLYNFLRWSEKYTKTDMVYLTKGGFWLTLGQIISSLSSFLLAIAFANLLPSETYGLYRFVLSTASLLTIPTLSGINTSMVRSVARGFEGSLVPAFKTKIKWGLLGGIASLLLAGYYFYNENTTLTICFLITSAFMPVMDSLSLYHPLYVGRKDFKTDIKYNVIVTAVSTTIIAGILFFTSNIFLIIFVYFLANSLLRFVCFYITLKKANINDKEDPQAIPYGKHLSLINIITTLASQLDKILVFHYLSATDLAIYSIAVAPINQIQAMTGIFSSLAFPKFAQKNALETKNNIKEKILKFSVMLLVVAILYIIAAPYLFQMIFPKYPESIRLSQLLAVSLVAASGVVLSSLLTAQKAQKSLYRFNVISSILQIITLIILIKFFGLFGAIITGVIIKYINLLMLGYYSKKLK